jgi:hypothetical protein
MTMNAVCELPAACQAALDELNASAARARALAELLDYFAGQLRGEPPDPEGPPLEACPTPGQVRRALERRDRAASGVERQWQCLPGELREIVPPVGEVLAGEGMD